MIRDIGSIESIHTIVPESDCLGCTPCEDGQTCENFGNNGVLVDPESINVASVLSQLLDLPAEEISQKMVTIGTNIGLGHAGAYRAEISANHDGEPVALVYLADEGGVVRTLDACMGRSILLSVRS